MTQAGEPQDPRGAVRRALLGLKHPRLKARNFVELGMIPDVRVEDQHTSPQDLAGMVVRKAAHMAEQLGVRLYGLVENMSHLRCPQCGCRIDVFGTSKAEKTVEQCGVPMLGHLPLDPELAVKCDQGKIEDYRLTDRPPPVPSWCTSRSRSARSAPVSPQLLEGENTGRAILRSVKWDTAAGRAIGRVGVSGPDGFRGDPLAFWCGP